MPNLVAPPAGSTLTAEHLAAAEALIAAQFGVATLEREEGVAESGMVGSSGLITLTRPAVSIQTLTLWGTPAAGILRSPWTLDASGLLGGTVSLWGGAPLTTPYTVVYTAGWTAHDLPPGLRQAVLSVARGVAAGEGREGLKSEGMGPVSKSYTETGTLSPDALALLRPWLPLRF